MNQQSEIKDQNTNLGMPAEEQAVSVEANGEEVLKYILYLASTRKIYNPNVRMAVKIRE